MKMSNKVAKQIVEDLFSDLNDRRGMHVSNLDEETREEIRSVWERLIVMRLSGRGEQSLDLVIEARKAIKR
jgi:hypothetical protein